jgi:siderophore synthetase component
MTGGASGQIVSRAFPEAESQRIARAVVAIHGLPRPWIDGQWSEGYRRSLAAELVDVFRAHGVRVEAWDENYMLQVRAPESVLQWLIQQTMNSNPMGFGRPGPTVHASGQIMSRAFPEAESKRIAAAVVAIHGLARPWVQSPWSEGYRRSLAAELIDVFRSYGVRVEARDENYMLQVRAPESVLQWLIQL